MRKNIEAISSIQKLSHLGLFLSVLGLIFLCGCGKGEQTETAGAKEEREAEEEQGEIDVDLTQMSSTMVYSEVFQMMSEPQKYVGKKVRIKGDFAIYQADPDVADVDYYYTVLISDAAACCQQGMEFIWDGHSSPEDFPDPGTILTVTGIFETYEEGDAMYCRLEAEEVLAEEA